MRKSKYILQLLLITLIMGIQSCQDEAENTLPELVADFVLSADSGLTTTIFRFDVAGAIDFGDKNNPVFIRFDWNADGLWDIMHSSLPVYEHRYYLPGRYQAIMEVSRVSGETDTIVREIKVEQGYSPPQPVLIIQPDSSNLLTEFQFDGSLTHDDEDSLETLLFRWDFDGDEIWDTDFQSNPKTRHTFTTPMYFNTIMEVKDTMNLIGRIQEPVIVNLLNHLIKPKVNISCGHCTVEDLFSFDASESYEEGKPNSKLLYSWNLQDDDLWELEKSDNPIYTRSIGLEGIYPIRLRVTAPDGLYMDTIFEVESYPWNTAPNAKLTVGCRVGNPLTEFYFHSRRSVDRDESMMNLRIRWDLDNDGQWDTDLNDQMNVYRSYDEPGKYIVRMAVIDSGDKETIDIDSIMVFEGNHETGLIIDKRVEYGEEYGIVKIGNQWWMQENCNSEFDTGDSRLSKRCYRDDPINCEKYGGIYLYNYARSGTVCPKGWKVPKVEDFETLMANLKDDHVAKLLFGGTSEFHIQLAGYYDHSKGYLGMNSNAHFWTKSFSNNFNPIAWYYNPGKEINQKVLVSSSYEFYVRCIKE